MAGHRVYPPCVHCGSQRDATGKPTSKAEMTGWANDGEIPLYYLKCLHCGEHWIAFLGALPPHASLSALDEGLRLRRRNEQRRRHGYATGTHLSTRGAKRIDSDRILATIRIQPGRVVTALARRLGRSQRNAPWADTAEELA